MSRPQPNTPANQSSKFRTQPINGLFTPGSLDDGSSENSHHSLLQESQQRQARDTEAHELRMNLMCEESRARMAREDELAEAKVEIMKEESVLRKEIMVKESAEREQAVHELRDFKLFGMK